MKNLDFQLQYKSPGSWGQYISSNIDVFLSDHAAAEKKASGMALSMISHYPDKNFIVAAMIELAVEELHHYRDVVRIMQKRHLVLQPDQKDSYVHLLRKQMRSPSFTDGYDCYLLDRLLVAAIIEARGAERFQLIADYLNNDPALKSFYLGIAQSESRHYQLFLNLAQHYFSREVIVERLEQLVEVEAEIMVQQPRRIALH